MSNCTDSHATPDVFRNNAKLLQLLQCEAITMQSFYNAKECFFAKNPGLYGENTLAECAAHSKVY